MAEGASAPDYCKIISDHREELLTALKATDWIESKNKNGIRITYRQTDKGKMYVQSGHVLCVACSVLGDRFHIEHELDIPPSIGPRYCSPGPHNGIREKFQRKSAVKSVEVIEEQEKYFITREVLHGAMMGIVSERDMICLYGSGTDSENGTYMMHPSIEHPGYPPQTKPVRATKYAGGHLFFPVEGNPNKCQVHAFFLASLGGMLPVSVVDSFQTGIYFDFSVQWKQAVANKYHENN